MLKRLRERGGDVPDKPKRVLAALVKDEIALDTIIKSHGDQGRINCR